MSGYLRRLIDDQLDRVFAGLPAVAIEGARGVGKSETAKRRARSVLQLDRRGELSVIGASPDLILREERPVLIDEWQFVPETWNVVRHAVDADRRGGQFLLTGSAWPTGKLHIHSGAGRITRLHLRPMSLPERGIVTPTVSLATLTSGSGAAEVYGRSEMQLGDYADAITASGFPGIHRLDLVERRLALQSYVASALDRDLGEAGVTVRRPAALRGWLSAYAAASSTTTSYTKILDAATGGESDKPARPTSVAYREALERLWLLDPLPAWLPAAAPLKRLASAPKHHLADPALAAILLDVSAGSLLRGLGATVGGTGALLGALFESLAALSVRAIASAHGFGSFHMRTRGGEHEVDLIVELGDGRILAIEVKMSDTVDDRDVRHLLWLRRTLGERVADLVILNSGLLAHRRADGVAVIPLALLGP